MFRVCFSLSFCLFLLNSSFYAEEKAFHPFLSTSDFRPVWHPDGSWIYFYSYRDGVPQVWRIRPDGSAQEQVSQDEAFHAGVEVGPNGEVVTSVFEMPGWKARPYALDSAHGLRDLFADVAAQGQSFVGRWSPDGKWLSFSKKGKSGEIFAYHLKTNQRKQLLTSDIPAFFNAWRPDGGAILFSRDKALWILELDSQQERKLTEAVLEASNGDWSPDGKSVVFQGKVEGMLQLFLIRLADGSTEQLTNEMTNPMSPRFSPDGATVAFDSGAHGLQELFLLDMKTKKKKRLTFDSYMRTSPHFSTGKTVYVDRLMGNSDIWLREGQTKPIQITHSEHEDLQPVLNRQADKVAFVSLRMGSADLFATAVGGQAEQVTSLKGDEVSPSWSPSGDQLAFIYNVGDKTEIGILNLTTREIKFHNVPHPLRSLSWSPVGNKLLLEIVQNGGGDLATFDPVRNAFELVLESPEDEANPSWSSNGESIVFERVQRRNSDLWVMELASKTPRLILDSPWTESDPVWGQDDQVLLFHSNRGGNYQIWSYDLKKERLDALTTASKGGMP
jgi:TolB protein